MLYVETPPESPTALRPRNDVLVERPAGLGWAGLSGAGLKGKKTTLTRRVTDLKHVPCAGTKRVTAVLVGACAVVAAPSRGMKGVPGTTTKQGM